MSIHNTNNLYVQKHLYHNYHNHKPEAFYPFFQRSNGNNSLYPSPQMYEFSSSLDWVRNAATHTQQWSGINTKKVLHIKHIRKALQMWWRRTLQFFFCWWFYIYCLIITSIREPDRSLTDRQSLSVGLANSHLLTILAGKDGIFFCLWMSA